MDIMIASSVGSHNNYIFSWPSRASTNSWNDSRLGSYVLLDNVQGLMNGFMDSYNVGTSLSFMAI